MRETLCDIGSGKHTAAERSVTAGLADDWGMSLGTVAQRLAAFPRHVRRQDVARFLVRYELFKLALHTHGSIIEVGCYMGAGLFTWLHCSSILEPYNYQRRIVGFDTFAGFPSVSGEDTQTGSSNRLTPGEMAAPEGVEHDIADLAAIHDANRPLGHIPKLSTVKGDVCKTLPTYLNDHPETLVSLLYLDADLYEPTRRALGWLYERVVKGGVIAFDELNDPTFPGETKATWGFLNAPLRRFPFDPGISYMVKE